MIKNIKVAVVQTKVAVNSQEGESRLARFMSEAKINNIDMIGFSEDCICPLAEAVNGYDPLVYISKLARENKVYIFGANTRKEDDGTLRNVGFVFDRNGQLITKHFKIVLTPPEEKDGLIPGKSIEIFNTEFGKMALLVCKDAFHKYAAWFFDEIRKAGADVVLIPSYSINVSRRSLGMWVDSLKSLSRWFDVYIAASGTVGANNTGYNSFGHALIVCPNREVIAEGSDNREEILYAELDKNNLEEIRSTYGSKWQPKGVPDFTIKQV